MDKMPYKEYEHVKDISKNIGKGFERVIKKIKNEDHPNRFEHDDILEELTKLFEEKVGKPCSEEEYKAIYKEGEERYFKKIPPGFEDFGKNSNDKSKTKKFGDLVAWKQIIEKAKEAEKPVILVTDDTKKDWWLKVDDDKFLGPRPELIKEFFLEANVKFYMYRPMGFLKLATEYLKLTVKEDTIEEVGRISEIELEALPIFVEGTRPIYERLPRESVIFGPPDAPSGPYVMVDEDEHGNKYFRDAPYNQSFIVPSSQMNESLQKGEKRRKLTTQLGKK